MFPRSDAARAAFVSGLVVCLVLMGFITFAPPARANHETISWAPPTFLKDQVGFADLYPSVLADPHGYLYVFYGVSGSGAGADNFNVTKYTHAGKAGQLQALFDTAVSGQTGDADLLFPIRAAFDPSGAIDAVYFRFTPDGGEVWLSKSVDGGATWPSPVEVGRTGSLSELMYPGLTITPSGTVYVAWAQWWNGVESTAVARSTNGGTSFTQVMNVTESTGVESVALASDAGGRVYLAWGSPILSRGFRTVDVLWSDDGTTWSSPTNLTTIESGSLPALYADAAGVVHVAWWSGPFGNIVVRYSRSTDRGVTWSLPIVILPAAALPGQVGSLAGEGDTVMYAAPGVYGNVSFAVSGDHGVSWSPWESWDSAPTASYSPFSLAADTNDTMWAVYSTTSWLYTTHWEGPPSAPTLLGVAPSGTSGLSVTWRASPETDVQEYRVWRSVDGSTYQIVAVVPAGTTSYTDAGLSDGTYWYKLDAVNGDGTPSHASFVDSGTVGRTTAQLLAGLEGEIASLRAMLNATNASLAQVQNELSALQGQQAPLLIAVLAVLAVQVAMLVVLLRRPKGPAGAPPATGRSPPDTNDSKGAP